MSQLWITPSEPSADAVHSSPSSSNSGYQSATAHPDKVGQRCSSICDSGLGSISSGTESFRQSVAEEELLRSRVRCVGALEDEGFAKEPPAATLRVATASTDTDFFCQDPDGDTQLHTGIILNQHELVNRIIASAPTRWQLNLPNDLQQTALHFAVSTKQPTVVRDLLHAGADLFARDWRGNMAVHLACRDGSVSCLRELVEAACSADLQQCSSSLKSIFDVHNYEGLGPLHLAAAGRHLDAIRFLVKSQVADVNFSEAKAGRTLLHLAVEADDGDLLRLALELGAEPGVRSYAGVRPAAVAKAWRREAMMAALKAVEDGLQSTSDSSTDGDDGVEREEQEMECSESSYDDFRINGLPVALNDLQAEASLR